ncbi:MAG: hypothetical protein K0R92_355 [Lachnospiraceae bacterium]|jgi:hypothetical protein|nr:hypothetical protein [Lachnospiraceae bacterium]
MANKILAGDYAGKPIMFTAGKLAIGVKLFKNLELNKNTVESFEVITDDIRKSAASGIARGAVGGVLLGPIGMLGGALSAKNKGTYQIALLFKDGKRSLIEVDDKFYKELIKVLF